MGGIFLLFACLSSRFQIGNSWLQIGNSWVQIGNSWVQTGNSWVQTGKLPGLLLAATRHKSIARGISPWTQAPSIPSLNEAKQPSGTVWCHPPFAIARPLVNSCRPFEDLGVCLTDSMGSRPWLQHAALFGLSGIARPWTQLGFDLDACDC